MSFIDLVKTRYSVRKYSDKPIPPEVLNQVLEAGRLSPTAANKQPQRIYVLKSENALAKIRSITKMAFNAPIVLLICYDRNISWKNTVQSFGEEHDSGEMDASIVTTIMMMEATDLGLGTLWARGFKSQDLIDAFELPVNISPVCMLLLGYPDDETNSKRTPRKPIEDTVIEL